MDCRGQFHYRLGAENGFACRMNSVLTGLFMADDFRLPRAVNKKLFSVFSQGGNCVISVSILNRVGRQPLDNMHAQIVRLYA